MDIKTLKGIDFITSTDANLAALLTCKGHQIEQIIKDDSSSRATFIIQKNEKTDALIKKYFAHELKVEPLSLLNALKEIKVRLHNL